MCKLVGEQSLTGSAPYVGNIKGYGFQCVTSHRLCFRPDQHSVTHVSPGHPLLKGISAQKCLACHTMLGCSSNAPKLTA